MVLSLTQCKNHLCPTPESNFKQRVFPLFFQEIVSIFIDQVFRSHEGKELSATNLLGMFVCILGIVIHVVRKSKQPQGAGEARSGPRIRGGYRKGPSQHAEFDLPLLSDEDSDEFLSSDEDFAFPRNGVAAGGSGGAGKPASGTAAFTEEFLLGENRAWTSVRERHLEMPGLDTEDEMNVPEILRTNSMPSVGAKKEEALLPDLDDVYID